MQNWFPFFSMLLWWCVKVSGLSMLLAGFLAFLALLNGGFGFWATVSMLLTVAVGLFLLTTELIYDLAIAEMQRRHAVAK